ncbi:MAG TPA: ATP-binding domain-containing protein [Bacillus bacterium]|nr:ATP-binding domain-containing protein [Bacillus sp. (in: firmicutes)]
MEDFASRLKYLEAVLKNAKTRKGKNVVTFSTFHSAKGLEFEHVFMVDLIDGILPSSDEYRSGTAGANAMDEATRLFYVGMTRAKKHLELIGYRERDGEKVQESSFVSYVKSILSPPAERVKVDKDVVHVEVKKKVRVGTTTIPYNPNAIREQGELQKGKLIKHRVFGRGEIVKLSEDLIEVRFQAGVKNLAVQTCLEMGLLEPV